MTNINKLQTLKITCEDCGQKHLKTVAWLIENQEVECECGAITVYENTEELVMQAVNELK